MSKAIDRKAFETIATEMTEKYSSTDIDYDFMPAVTDCIQTAKKKMNELDDNWRRENVTLGDRSRQAVHSWKLRIEILPAFLSEGTIAEVHKLDAEADRLISEGKIEDVIIYFDRLNIEEKHKCLNLLQQKL